jgi:hypothetical protein
MGEVELWCRVTVVASDGSELARHVLGGTGRPDLEAVDDIARTVLDARRLGAAVVLVDAARDLVALLDLAGLGVEVEGQTERGEEPLGIEEGQEELHPHDPAG